MAAERKTAGLLPSPVWLLVRAFFEMDPPKALGPITTLEKLRGVAEGIAFWANDKEAAIRGFAHEVPPGYKEVSVDGPRFAELEELTFEKQLTNVLWFDYREQRWDSEKEWNADRWQDVGLLLEMFGIEYPGDDAPLPADAGVEDP